MNLAVVRKKVATSEAEKNEKMLELAEQAFRDSEQIWESFYQRVLTEQTSKPMDILKNYAVCLRHHADFRRKIRHDSGQALEKEAKAKKVEKIIADSKSTL